MKTEEEWDIYCLILRLLLHGIISNAFTNYLGLAMVVTVMYSAYYAVLLRTSTFNKHRDKYLILYAFKCRGMVLNISHFLEEFLDYRTQPEIIYPKKGIDSYSKGKKYNCKQHL